MNRYISCAIAIGLSGILIACGGGGGGGGATADAGGGVGGNSSTTPTPVSLALKPAFVNLVQAATTRSFSISGSVLVNGKRANVTGSGSATTSPLTSTVFEGKPALQATTTFNSTLTVNGSTLPVNSTSTDYYDTNYSPLGSLSDEYRVLDAPQKIPDTVKAGDSGIFYTETRYSDSSKRTVVGTAEVSYEVLPDTATSLMIKVTEVDINSGSVASMPIVDTFILTNTNSLVRVTETSSTSNLDLTINY